MIGYIPDINRSILDGSMAFIAGLAISSTLLTLITMNRPHVTLWKDKAEWLQIGAVIMLSWAMAFIFASAAVGFAAGAISIAPFAGLALLFCIVFRWLIPSLSAAGVTYMAFYTIMVPSSLAWSLLWFHESGHPIWFFAVFGFLAIFTIINTVILAIVRLGAHCMTLLKVWQHPIAPQEAVHGTGLPKVSIHVPCHAEPPDIVTETLNHLAKLDYGDYEVIVCDNNTTDVALWRPVEAHCRQMNAELGEERFRFFHVEGMKGAKAGALNFCLDHTDTRATLVALVDADYAAEPDFLARLVGFFKDENFAFVQTSHDYRDSEKNLFNKLCYWEYLIANKLDFTGSSELKASFTIGTMCVFRKSAIEKVGRWAEWCLTEDSEIAIRLRAHGYDGIFLRDTFGRGLTPETFIDWKRQRFRWTAGPVQQFLTHWRLFLPDRLGGSPNLSAWCKISEVARSIWPVVNAVELVGLVAIALVLPFLMANSMLPQLKVPAVGWFCAVAGFLSTTLRLGLLYWLGNCKRIVNIVGSEIGGSALNYVRMASSLAALFGKELAWQRTPKFETRLSYLQAIRSALPELTAGLGFVAVMGYVISHVDRIGITGILFAGSGLMRPAVAFLAAPVMALLATRRSRSWSKSSGEAHGMGQALDIGH